ncbi:MAG: serine/threonine-protein kinase [Acidobacteriota bacterium]
MGKNEKNDKSAELIGKRLANKFHLQSLIGEGGFGAVFRARDQDTNQIYAIKILYLDNKMTPAQRVKEFQFFQREVGILARVRHPGIVHVYDGGLTEEGLPYLVMEMVEGELLSNIFKAEGRLSLYRVTSIFSQLCAAVATIHQQGIIHRDLKPENIMVRRDNEGNEIIKLLDFGLAKVVRGETDNKWLGTLTGRGQIHGTIYYMSPEQCEGKKLDERTDIYSLGVMIYELLAGKPPFHASSPLGIMAQHLDTLPPPLRAQRPDLPVEVEIAILKALEKDRNKRYQNVLDFSNRLEQIAADCAVAQLRAGGDPNARPETGVRTQVIPIDERRLTVEIDTKPHKTNSLPINAGVKIESKTTRRMSRLWEFLNKLKGE